MSLSSRIRSLSGGIITFLVALTLLATQLQPLLASQMDDLRKCEEMRQPAGCEQKVDDWWKGKEKGNENGCKAGRMLFDCVREAVCRLCDTKEIAEFLVQDFASDSQVQTRITMCTQQFGHEFKLVCPSSSSTSSFLSSLPTNYTDGQVVKEDSPTSILPIICLALGIITVLCLLGALAFLIKYRGSSSRTRSRLRGNKSTIQTFQGTSKSVSKSESKSTSKSTKISSSTGGSSGIAQNCSTKVA